MLAPGNLSFHLRYADLLYNMGGSNSIQTALGYYCHAVEMSSGNCNRATFGICNCLGLLKRNKVWTAFLRLAQINSAPHLS